MQVVFADSDTLSTRYSSLTNRERQVMSAVVSGNMNKQIAYQLGISQITVKVHRGQVMRKMQAGSLAELVTMAMRLHPLVTILNAAGALSAKGVLHADPGAKRSAGSAELLIHRIDADSRSEGFTGPGEEVLTNHPEV